MKRSLPFTWRISGKAEILSGILSWKPSLATGPYRCPCGRQYLHSHKYQICSIREISWKMWPQIKVIFDVAHRWMMVRMNDIWQFPIFISYFKLFLILILSSI